MSIYTMIFLAIILLFLAISGAHAQQEPYGAEGAQGREPSISIRLSGNTTAITLPDTLYVGLILAGACDSITLPIINDDLKAITIDTLYLEGGDAGDFAILAPASGVIEQIEPGNRFNLLLRFCSTLPQCSRTSLFLVVRPVDGSFPPRLHRVGMSGCAGMPRAEVDRERIEFGSVNIGACGIAQFSIRNTGNYPLRFGEVQGGDPPFMLPQRDAIAGGSILPDSIMVITVRFCPERVGNAYDTIRILTINPDAFLLLPLQGEGIISPLEIANTMDFGTLLQGSCRDTVLVIRNQGQSPFTITRAALELSGFDTDFQVTTSVSTGQPLVIPPGDTAHLHLRYCPTGAGAVTATLKIGTGSSSDLEVVLRGDAVAAVIWLDTTSGTAGDLVRLNAHINPELRKISSITSYRLRLGLRLRLTALVPKQLIPVLPGSTFAMTFDDFGNVTITLATGDTLPDDGLIFTLVLRGLSTADPANPVTIESVSIADIPEIMAGNGLVLLDGCDISHGGVQISRGLTLKSVTAEPAGARIGLLYRAPEGESPTVSIYDLSGRLLKTFALEPGTGADQRAEIPAGPLHRGPYLLELSTGTGRVTTPVMVE